MIIALETITSVSLCSSSSKILARATGSRGWYPQSVDFLVALWPSTSLDFLLIEAVDLERLFLNLEMRDFCFFDGFESIGPSLHIGQPGDEQHPVQGG